MMNPISRLLDTQYQILENKLYNNNCNYFDYGATSWTKPKPNFTKCNPSPAHNNLLLCPEFTMHTENNYAYP